MLIAFLLIIGLLLSLGLGLLRLGTTMRNAGVAALAGVMNQGSAAGKVKVYTSTQPGSVGGTYGTILGTLVGSDPFFGSPSTGVVTASSITSDTSADNSGTAGTGTLVDSDDNVLADFTCGTSGTDAIFDNATIVSGGTIAISAMTLTQPI